MTLREWDERYRTGGDAFSEPTPLAVEMARRLAPGRALDLACGAGRHAIYLATHRWAVRALDGSSRAVELVRERAAAAGVSVDAAVADLEHGRLEEPAGAYDLVVCAYYLHRPLYPGMKSAVRPGGVVISIVHLADEDQPRGSARRAYPGELRAMFAGWKILHYCEGEPRESCHKRAVAEIAAQRPE